MNNLQRIIEEIKKLEKELLVEIQKKEEEHRRKCWSLKICRSLSGIESS